MSTLPDEAETFPSFGSLENAGCDQSERILVVDDEEPVRRLIKMILENSGYRCETVENSAEARGALARERYQLVLSDINMPGESGLNFIRYVLNTFSNTAAIMVSAISDSDLAKSMIDLGVYDYIIKPVDRNSVLISVANALRRQQLETANRILRLNLERKVRQRTRSLQRSKDKLEKTMKGIVKAMAHTVETRDPYTAGHQRRVARLAKAIASKIGLSDEQQDAVNVAAIVHDLGKISIPAEILTKPSRLSPNEFNLIKEHPRAGYDILKEIEFPWDVATIVMQHHEKLDGSGYPLGLHGDEIRLESQVITVADVVEAMASHRPYRPGLGIEAAVGEIRKNKARYYNPVVTEACVEVFESDAFSFQSVND